MVRRGGPVRVSAVAEDLHVDVSVASRQLAALEADGHVERTSDPGDGRSCLLPITPAGEQTLSAAHERMVGAFSATVADWTLSDLATLTALLARLRGDYARSVSEAGRPFRPRRSPRAGASFGEVASRRRQARDVVC